MNNRVMLLKTAKQKQRQLSVRYSVMLKFLLIALSLTMLGACSKQPLIVQTPPLEANLASPCAKLPQVPNPLIDPYRAEWESDLIHLYEDCSVKHRFTVDAWPKK